MCLFSAFSCKVKNRCSRYGLGLLAILILHLACAGGAWSATYYVDCARPDDAGDGRSWAGARKTLQPALDAAAANGGGEVWVKGGVYDEARRSNDGALAIYSRVHVYGGFAGGETLLSQRDVKAHPTVISGARARAGQAAYHVVYMMNVTDCRLDGFTITGGIANSSTDSLNACGGGVFCYGADYYNLDGSPNAATYSSVIANCTITGNTATSHGGGLYLEQSKIRLSSCTLLANTAQSYGGGAYSTSSAPIFEQCAFERNVSSAIGGGIDCDTTDANVPGIFFRGCTFRGNYAQQSGGGLECLGFSGPCAATLTNCIFEGNRSPYGGAAMLSSNAAVAMANCTLNGNTASSSNAGGGVYVATSSASFINTIFAGNTNLALAASGSPALVRNCLFFGNPQGDYAASALLSGSGGNVSGDPRLSSDARPGYGSAAVDRGTAEGAPATDIAGQARPVDIPGLGQNGTGTEFDIGAWEVASTAPRLEVSTSTLDFGQLAVKGGPAARSLTLTNAGFTTLTFRGAGCLLGGAHPGDFAVSGAFDASALAPGASRSLAVACDPGQLGATSATLQFLSNDPATTTTVLLAARGVPTVYADAMRPDDSGDGRSWASAKKTLQAAIDLAAQGGGEVWVKTGVYGERRSQGSDGALVLKSGVQLYGGFAGGEGARGQRNPVANPATISGATSRGGNAAYHVIRLSGVTSCLLDGFTISGGAASAYVSPDNLGGGLYGAGAGASNAIVNCVIRGCSARNLGGGAYFQGAAPIFTGCLFAANSSSSHGAGCCLSGASGAFTQCTFSGNASTGQGAGCYLMSNAAAALTQCSFTGNAAGGNGGGLGIDTGAALTLTSCTLAGNKGVSGGGLSVSKSTATVSGCSFTSNTTTNNGGGAYFSEASFTMNRCMLNNNLSSGAGGVAISNCNDARVANTTISGNVGSRDGGGMVVSGGQPDRIVIESSVITRNKGARGGVTLTGTATFRNCALTENRGDNAGGMALLGGTLTMVNCTVSGNSSAQHGGGIYSGMSSKARLKNTILAGNNGVAVYNTPDSSYVSFKNCLFHDNPDGDYRFNNGVMLGAEAINSLPDDTGQANTGNVDGDPRLIHGWVLGAGSAALDQGTTEGAPATDLAGRARPVDIPGVGSGGLGGGYDIGAWELPWPLPPMVNVLPARLDFSTQTLASGPSAPLAVNMVNMGGSPLQFAGAGFRLAGAHPEDFAFAEPPTLEPLDSATTRIVRLRYVPHRLGLTSATLEITTNDAEAPLSIVVLAGYATPESPSLAAEPSYTAGGQNTIAWAAFPAAAGYEVQCSAAPDFAPLQGAAKLPASALSHTFTGLAGNLRYWYRVRALDSQGKAGPWSEAISSVQDATAPNGSVALAGAAAQTNQTQVALTLAANDGTSGSGVARMHLSNDGGSWSDWEPFAPEKLWTLSSGDGLKTVYVQYQDAVGNITSSVIAASITLDQSGPVGSVRINSGADVTNQPQVTLTLAATDLSLVARMRLSGNGTTWTPWEPWAATKAWTLPSGDGAKAVYVQFEDVLGNVSAASSAITLDQTPPQPSTPRAADGRAYTITGAVTFQWSAADPQPGSGVAAYDCQIGTAPGSVDIFNGPLGAAREKTVNGPLGKTLYCRVRAIDEAGNISPWSASSAGIFVDTPPPAPALGISPTLPRTLDDIQAVVNASDPDPGDQVAEYRYEWRRAGALISTSPVLDDALTTKGQNWTLRVQARDGYGAWSQPTSCAFAIANTPPTQPIVDIRPQPARAGQGLVADIIDYSTDPDGDPIAYDFTWFKSSDGGKSWIHKVELDGSPQVVGNFILDGEIWEVHYTPYERVAAKPDAAPRRAGRVEGQYAMARAYIGANTPPGLYLNTPLYRTLSGGARQLEVTWQYNDQDGDACQVDLGWTDRKGSGVQKLAANVPAQQRSFKVTTALPTDRPVYIFGVIRDAKQSDTQVFSPAVLVERAAKQRLLDYLLGKSSDTSGLDVNGDRAVNVADLIKSQQPIVVPGTPAQPSPALKATGVALRPTLDWADCARATSYQLYLWPATSARPATPTAKGFTASTFRPAADLVKGVKYNWQVVAISNAALTYGPVWSFTTRP